MELIKITRNENNDQLVSGRDLHKILEVKTRFSLWVEQNFKHFRKDVDFSYVVGTTQQNQHGGTKEIDDYALVLDMAKHIAMMTGTPKGFEIRDYFIEVEKEFKNNQLDTSNLSPELQMFNGLFQSLAKQELATKKLESKVDNIATIVSLDSNDWRTKVNKILRSIAQKRGGYDAYREVGSESYDLLERRAKCNLNIRLKNRTTAMIVQGATKTSVKKLNKLDVIGDDTRLLEIYLSVVKDMAIREQVDFYEIA